MSVRCEPTRALCNVLLSSCLYEILVWNSYACVFYAKPALERTQQLILCTEFRYVPLPTRGRESTCS